MSQETKTVKAVIYPKEYWEIKNGMDYVNGKKFTAGLDTFGDIEKSLMSKFFGEVVDISPSFCNTWRIVGNSFNWSKEAFMLFDIKKDEYPEYFL